VFDLWIRSATLIDGTGAEPRRASVGVRDGRIAEVEPTSGDPDPDARVTLDATGMVLAPGSIDVHNHSDVAPLIDPTMPSTIRQGVTTVVVGNCGMSPFPASTAAELASWVGSDHAASVEDLAFDSFGTFLERVADARPAVHVAALIGHGSVRELAMEQARRPPSPDELEAMRREVSEAMDAGAVGLSTGLIYAPGMYADTAEIVALAEEAARAGGIYASHIRGEGRTCSEPSTRPSRSGTARASRCTSATSSASRRTRGDARRSSSSACTRRGRPATSTRMPRGRRCCDRSSRPGRRQTSSRDSWTIRCRHVDSSPPSSTAKGRSSSRRSTASDGIAS
jgi:N-acyl-D-aspartate/D-glutamate deacylase